MYLTKMDFIVTNVKQNFYISVEFVQKLFYAYIFMFASVKN